MVELLRVLVDPGSQASFITQRAAEKLGIIKQRVHAEVTGLGDASPKIAKWKIEAQLAPRFPSDFTLQTSLLILPKLTQNLPQDTVDVNIDEWKNCMVADPTFNKSGPVDVILRANEYGKIVIPGLQKSPHGLIAQNTEFGWILSGGKISSKCNKINVQSMITRIDEDQQLTKFWELEEVEATRIVTEDDEICEDLYKETTKREHDGSYTVHIPFKSQIKDMGNSKSRAAARLKQLEIRFTKNPELHQEYTKFMDEYINLGHMKKVPEEKIHEGIYYIPHQPVIREASSTTKLRVVFDASCKTSNGVCLNEMMYPGPKLQQELIEILLRWRKYETVFSADVEKMYRQIKLYPDDQKYHRILWRTNPSMPVQEYELTTVTYGTTAAPYLAIRTLQQLAQDEKNKYPEASKITMRDFYVDDLLSGSYSVEEAVSLQNELINMFKQHHGRQEMHSLTILHTLYNIISVFSSLE